MVNNSIDLNLIFSALADPTRREILTALRAGQQAVADLAARFSMSAPAVSKHLRVLERAGLLNRQKEGRTHWISLDAEPLAEANEWIERYRIFWDNNFDALERYLDETDPGTESFNNESNTNTHKS
ncbi:ArsR/SmtB family transcription factor [Cerasicoccus frondis]|uniref:ArsR/SmtB family transcription factor n=1 Tax=Cerasicoccus frondis TaxID=490090 RepID=UPI002852A708|nr:metalloregulator ArsR/SmtB family transcription factor [Cerasicoccus frondis]